MRVKFKQIIAISGVDFKTVNGNSLLGSGDVSVGTVTNVSALTIGTAGNDIASSVTAGTTAPAITLNVPNASATARGVITTAAQTIAGAKTFSGALTVSATSATIGNSTAASTIAIGSGANASAVTKAITIGENGLLGSITNITFGSSVTGANNNILANGNIRIQPATSIERQISVDRMTATNPAGQLKIIAGGALLGATNATGGALILSSGMPTGNGTSRVDFMTYGGGVSGTADNNSPQTRMSILGNGNVGIGTTAPTSKLEVFDNSTSTPSFIKLGRFFNDTIITGSVQIQLGKSDTTGNIAGMTYVHVADNSPLNAFSLGFNSVRILTVLNSGNVGVGKKTPVAKLDIAGKGGIFNFAQYMSSFTATNYDNLRGTGKLGVGWNITNGGAEVDFISANTDSGSLLGGFGFYSLPSTASSIPAPLVRILGNGNVGIGAIVPTSKLQVVGLPNYADNASAITGGLTTGAFYHTAGVLKVVI